MSDLDQTLDVYVDNLMEHVFKCSVYSAKSGEQTADRTSSPTPRMEQSGPANGATTSPTGLKGTEPPFGGLDEEPEYYGRSWEDDAADDAGIPRFGEI